MHAEGRPTISVLMPAYNAAPFLQEAVASILGQTERDFELVLIDDGSTDATARIAQALCASDPRIRYFRQENQGIVAALNRGLELCRGEFIARMDADDVARPDRLQRQLAFLRRRPDVIICGSHASLCGEAAGRIRKPRTDRECRAWLLIGPCFVHPSVMFRRSVVDLGVRYRAAYRHAEDYDFFFQVGALGRLANIAQPLLCYRVHGGQITSTRTRAQRAMHVQIAVAHLAAAGIACEPGEFHEILWPEDSRRPRLGILLSAVRLFLRMMASGKVTPYLMAATCWEILRRERLSTPA